MTITFERPVGPHLDVKELEYLTALHQTGNKLRTDASVTSDDVITYLMSRHGIRADKDFVEQRLMPGLAGAMGDNSSAVFDICELTSILIMPHLKKVANMDDDFEKHLLFGKILEFIILDVFGREMNVPPKLNRDTMTTILETYGEVGIPAQVIDEMLNAAGVLGNPNAKLDVNTLMRATASDLEQYDLKWLDHPSTHYDDVFHGTSLDISRGGKSSDNEDPQEQDEDYLEALMKVFTLSTVDYVAENYSSKIFASILWLLVVILFFVYTFDIGDYVGYVDCQRYSSVFGCHIVQAILTWLGIFAQLSVLGTTFVVFASAGNSLFHNSTWISVAFMLIGMGTVAFASIVTFSWEFEARWPFEHVWFSSVKRTDGVDENGNEQVDPLYKVGYILIVCIGTLLLLIQLKTLIFILFHKTRILMNLPGASCIFVPGTVSSEHATKQSADFKIQKMVENALSMHEPDPKNSMRSSSQKRSSTQGAFGNALLNFHATVDDREQCGGVVWTFKKMWNKTIFTEDGIWLHSRLISSNLSQVFVACFYITFGILLIVSTSELFAEANAPTVSPVPTASPTPTPDFLSDSINGALEWAPGAFEYLSKQDPQFNERFYNDPSITPNIAGFASNILNAVPDELVDAVAYQSDTNVLSRFFDISMEVLGISERGDANDTGGRRRRLQLDFEDTTVHKWQAILALSVGGAAALAATISLAASLLPSSISTILQFRSGVIGSLRDKEFQGYREAPDLTTILFGSTFWGCVYTSGTIFGITAGILFLIVWQVTRPIFIRILSQLIGIGVTLLVKTVILVGLRHLLYDGFFRKNPLGSNLLLVVVECWNLGLTVGTMLFRLVKLIGVAFFYIARIDTPFLAKGVGNVFGIPLDSYPVEFRKDLLVHDAHHHPYMERLGVIYMLKLRYGDSFGTRAGSAWRLVVVLALMPWLRRYRLDEDEKEESFEHAEDGGELARTDEDGGQAMKREIIQLRFKVKALEIQLAKAHGQSNQLAIVSEEGNDEVLKESAP